MPLTSMSLLLSVKRSSEMRKESLTSKKLNNVIYPWEQINVDIGFYVLPLGDLPLGSDRCQPCTISRTATGKRLAEV